MLVRVSSEVIDVSPPRVLPADRTEPSGPAAAASSASARSSARSIRRASRSDSRIHWNTNAPSMATATNSPPAQRMPPASCWSANGSAQASPSEGYQSPAEQAGALHHGQPEHGVERRGQEHQQRPQRVRHLPRHRVEPDQRPEEQAADGDQVDVDELVHHPCSSDSR